MAYHCDEPGHTTIIIGGNYSQFSNLFSICKLIEYNDATGICKLKYHGYVRYVSATQLSNWYRVRTDCFLGEYAVKG